MGNEQIEAQQLNTTVVSVNGGPEDTHVSRCVTSGFPPHIEVAIQYALNKHPGIGNYQLTNTISKSKQIIPNKGSV